MRNIGNIIATIALLAATVPALAQTPLDRTREYRIWSAQQMVNRLADRFARTTAACDRLPERDACRALVIKTQPVMGQILDLAATVDDVQWAALIDAVHTFEAGNETALNSIK